MVKVDAAIFLSNLLAPREDIGEFGQQRRAGEQLDPLLAPGLQQQARHAAPQDGRGDHIGIEHQPHAETGQLAFFARRSARMLAIS